MSRPVPIRRHGGAPLFSIVAALVLGLAAWVLTGPPSAVAARQGSAPPGDHGPAQPEGEPPQPPVPPQPIGSADGGQSSSEGNALQPPPDLQSSYVVRVYKVRPSRLFKGLLESLQAEGYPPEDVDESNRRVKSSFVDFKQGNFELQ